MEQRRERKTKKRDRIQLKRIVDKYWRNNKKNEAIYGKREENTKQKHESLPYPALGDYLCIS